MKNKVVLGLALLAGLLFLCLRLPHPPTHTDGAFLPHSVKPTAKGADPGAGAGAGVVSQNAPLNPAPVAASPAVSGEGVVARPASAPEPGAAAALPEAQDQVWERPVAEPAFAAFQDWVRRYQSAP